MKMEELVRQELESFTHSINSKRLELKQKIILSNGLQKEIPALTAFINGLEARAHQMKLLLEKHAKS